MSWVDELNREMDKAERELLAQIKADAKRGVWEWKEYRVPAPVPRMPGDYRKLQGGRRCYAKNLQPGCFVPGVGLVLWVEIMPDRVEIDVQEYEDSEPVAREVSRGLLLEGVVFP